MQTGSIKTKKERRFFMIANIKGMAVWVLLILMFCIGCTLFKKSTKNTQQNKLETNEQTYLKRVDLKTANKETKIHTWWKDSLLYQYQVILENTEEKKQSSFNTENTQMARHQYQQKKTEPPDVWIFGIITVAIAGFLILVIKLNKAVS